MSVKTPYYTIIPCCPQGTMTGNFNITGALVADGVYKYVGGTYQDATTGMWFYNNFCYTIDYIDDVIPTYPTAFADTDINLTLGNSCTSINCPACNFIPAGIYYSFESCCTGEIVLLNGPTDPNSQFYFYWSSALPAVGIYDEGNNIPLPISESLGLIQGQCYLMTEVIGNDPSLPNLPSLGGVPGQLFVPTDGRTTCYVPDPITGEPELFGECQQCPPCYLLMSCDSTVAPFTTNQDLSAYLYSVTGQSWLMTGSDFDDVCFTVLLAPPNIPCNYFTSPITVETTCDCPCICYTVIANAKDCAYVDCDGNLQYTGPLVTSPPEKFCSLAYPAIIGNVLLPNGGGPSPIYIQNEGLCIDGECPVICYLLEDCDGIEDPIYSTSTSLLPYAIIGSVITIVGYPDTCWEVIDTAECDCAIDVSVINSYIDCPTCKGTPKYKLTNCDDPTTIVYTTSNLSAYVGEVIIRLDCPGCWIVEEVDLIPSDVPITVDTSYIGCVECARTYYLLEDCTGYLPDAITYTDLSAYVGSVIKLEYCPETCWEVSITLDPTNAGEVVFIDQEYVDCPECLLTLPCICITVRNDSTTSKQYRYYDCILDVQFFTLLPGETSGKFCIRAWAVYFPNTDYIEAFGDCSQATVQDPWTCPATIYPRRFIRPGYYVPTCSIEKFEKITCKAAEAMYKKVLEQRYGISNCCPEDDSKWLIKKELIDLAGLVDPNYICTTVQSCCNEAPNCGCTPLKTCNS
jgi:hypothetical protein